MAASQTSVPSRASGEWTGGRQRETRASIPAQPRVSDVPEQIQISAGRAVSVRASLADDNLDIPTFLRKQSE